MQEKPVEANDINEPDLDPIPNSSTHRFYFLTSWLNKFKKNKLECYSVLLGISGISLISLGICILILICTTSESHSINPIDCTILNITNTHVKLCTSHRCRIYNSCIPYICTIIFVHYSYNNLSYESQLYPFNIHTNSSCSYEPSSCTSRSRIQFEQMKFLEIYAFNLSKIPHCCLHSSTHQPILCSNYFNSTQYSLSIISIIICFSIGFILLLIGIITQLHLNDYLNNHQTDEEDILDTILNLHFSNGTIRSSIEKTSPVNYDILTETISHHNNTTALKDNLLFFEKERLRIIYQDEILKQYEFGNEEIKIILKKIEKDFKEENEVSLPENSLERIKYLLNKIDNLKIYFPNIDKQFSNDRISNSFTSPKSVSHPHVHFLIK